MTDTVIKTLLANSFSTQKKNFGFDKSVLLLKPPKDEIKGFPLHVSSDSIDLLVKILPLDLHYPLDSHPSLLEILVPKLLQQYHSESPHVVQIYDNMFVPNNASALTSFPIKNYHGEIYDQSAVLIAEFVNGGCLENYAPLKKPSSLPHVLSESDWKNIIFQVLWTIAIFQDKLEFMHNDLHAGNILINLLETNSHSRVKYKWYAKRNCITFTLPLCKFQTKLTDFEFAQCFTDVKASEHLYPNDFCFDHSDIPEHFNPHYDCHFFLTSLLDLDIPESIRSFITSLFPSYLIPDFGHGSHESSGDRSTRSYDSDSEDSFYLTDEDLHVTNSPDRASIKSHSDSPRSYSDSYTDDYTDTDTESTDEDAYIKDGRLLNDKYDLIKHLLPTPLQLVFCHPFFADYRTEDHSTDNAQTYRFYSSHGGDPRKIRKLPWVKVM